MPLKWVCMGFVFLAVYGCESNGADSEIRRVVVEHVEPGKSREEILDGQAGEVLKKLVKEKRLIHTPGFLDLDKLELMCKKSMCNPPNLYHVVKEKMEVSSDAFPGRIDDFVRPTFSKVCVSLEIYYDKEDRVVGWSFYRDEGFLCH